MNSWFRLNGWAIVFGFLAAAPAGPSAWAGGGPENVLLVVNAEDESSRMVANWYQRMRQIPDSNVLFLSGVPRSHSASLDQCRDLILRPLLKAVQERKLDGQIDCVIYSTGFPTRFDIAEDSKRFMEQMEQAEGKQDQQVAFVFSGSASLTALTYFAVGVVNKDPGYMGPFANNYYRKPVSMAIQQPFVGSAQADYEKAVTAIRDGNGAAAVKLLEPLAKANPMQMIVHYRLAQAWAAAEDVEQARRALVSAIRSGWCYRSHTREDPLLKNVRSDPLVRGLIDRIPDEPWEFLPTTGFSSRFFWGPGGGINSQPDQGNQYLLCTMLGVNWNNGNSELEIIHSLRESAGADFTRPEGTFFFSETQDVRTTTRKPNNEAAISRLVKMGMKAEICYTPMPMHSRVAGASLGTPKFAWSDSANSRIAPGAICENLTSYGGWFTQDSQTTLAELIRYGAAGSSGTVFEPFAIQFKFPHPLIQVHYARGCSLAEAFYQSVSGPFQLLIVGDALCQPWARPPILTATGLDDLQVVSGPVAVKVAVDAAGPAVSGVEVFLDGKLATRFNSLRDVTFDSTKISDGFHELRIVAIDATPLQIRARKVIPFQIDNGGLYTRLSASVTKVPVEGTFQLAVETNAGQSLEILHAGERVGQLDRASGVVEVAAVRIGRGPAELMAVARDSRNRTVSSIPLRVEITGDLAEKTATVPDR